MKSIISAISLASGLLAITTFAPAASANVIRHDVALSECPPAVQATIIDNARNGDIDEVEFTRIDGADLYVAEVKLPGKRDVDVYVAGDGRLLQTKEELAWTELPARVQQTLQQQTGAAGRIDDLSRTIRGKIVTFSAEIELRGQPDVDVEIAADGRLLAVTQELDD